MLNFLLFCCIVLFVVAICFWFRARNHSLWRQILYKTHLWLGIISGLVVFVICLSGMLLAFRAEIFMFFEHDRYFVSHTDKLPLNMDDLIDKVEQNINGKVNLIITYNRSDIVYRVQVKIEDGKNVEGKQKFRTEIYWVDPYTGEVLAKRSGSLTEFFNIVNVIHRRLFLPRPIGRIIVGSATLIFIVVVLSGFCLWLPANFRNIKLWKNGFLVQFRKSRIQLLYDLHKTLGFYALIPVLLMALTGLMESFQWYSNGVQMIFNAQHISIPPIKSPPKNPNAKRLPLEFFIKKADELIEYKGTLIFPIPEQEDSPVTITKAREEVLKLTVWNKIRFDQYTGEVLRFERSEDIPTGEKFVSLFYGLHTGGILGLPTKIIYFLACLIATTLPITGVIIWWRKLRNLHKAKYNQRQSA
jgi:uncharacterized iron-regulated membrane protein